MDRNFFLPIAVAAGVHSLLFISGAPTDTSSKPPAPATTSSYRELTLPPIEPDLIEPEPGDDKTSKEPPPPQTPEVISVDVDPGVITRTIEWRDLLPRPGAPDADRISSDWPEATGPGSGPVATIFDPISLDNNPMARFQPAPLYPQDLKPTGMDGSATIMFSVDVNGDVFDATVTRTSHTRFGEEALRAVKRWRFEPGIKNNKRVAFRMVQTFSFALSE